MIKHFMWLYLLLGSIAFANEFPSDQELNLDDKVSRFPTDLAVEKVYKKSNEQWEAFKLINQKDVAQFPAIDDVKPSIKTYDEIINISKKTIHANSLDPNLLVFASFSMPEPRLKILVKDVVKAAGVVLFRGLLMDAAGKPSFKLTADKLKSLQLKKGEGIQIAPNLFEQYGISRIPAFLVFGKGACLKCSNEKPKFHQAVYGDVSLRYAIKDIEDREPQLSGVIEPMLRRLDVSFFEASQ
jgi:type-F conjugative transfer system pilin assembly protein TrbC